MSGGLRDLAVTTRDGGTLTPEDGFRRWIAITSSGNSPNIVRALDTARSIPMQIVTVSGKGADNRARALGDLNFYVPSQRYGWVECAHQLILHYWLDQYLNLHVGGAL